MKKQQKFLTPKSKPLPIRGLIPRHKLDLTRAQAAVAAGYPAIAPVLPELLEWLQDYNWPVAHILQPFLAGIGLPLAPHLRRILQTDDEVWKYWVIVCLIKESAALQAEFRHELTRLATSPTVRETREELPQVASETLQLLHE